MLPAPHLCPLTSYHCHAGQQASNCQPPRLVARGLSLGHPSGHKSPGAVVCPPLSPESVGASIPQLSCPAVGGTCTLHAICHNFPAAFGFRRPQWSFTGYTSPFIEAFQSLPHKHLSWCFLGHLPSNPLAFDSLSQGLLLGGLRLPSCLPLRLR